MTFSSTFLRAHRRGPEGAAAQAVTREYAESVGFSGRVGARTGEPGPKVAFPHGQLQGGRR